VTAYGAVTNDGKDDTLAIQAAIAASMGVDGPVVVKLPAGRLIVSDILYLNRGSFALVGAGNGNADGATTLYFPSR